MNRVESSNEPSPLHEISPSVLQESAEPEENKLLAKFAFKQTALSLPVKEEQSLNEDVDVDVAEAEAEAEVEVVLVEVVDVFVIVARVVVGLNVVTVVAMEDDDVVGTSI
ncbi:unnamed protein product [[Candida] boidinii]|uniref:Unnamed protein product n=1 Tax=Candida boidinii TaxID=5477 RepID=A0ACB5U3T3_CANBO|nr:unnamed protein product [[Candida] boidinii]